MTRITQILTTPVSGAYYFEDLHALQAQPIPVEARYTAPATAPGLKYVREPSRVLAVGLVLNDKHVAWGDCVSVAYSGAGGRDPALEIDSASSQIKDQIAPLLLEQDPRNFRDLSAKIDQIRIQVTEERILPERKTGDSISRRELFQAAGQLLANGPRTEKVALEKMLPAAVRYGVSQALFSAAAMVQDLTLTELICREWNLDIPDRIVPLHAQCGGNRYRGVDKMIIRQVSSLPHALIDNLKEQLGDDAVELIRYTRWIKNRIKELGGDNYLPTIHLDLHGGPGKIYDGDLGKILGTLDALEKAAAPYPLRIECPVIQETRESQIETLATLREYIAFRKLQVEIVADEWANSLDDIQAFLSGSAADMIQIKMPDLGSLEDIIEAVRICRSCGVKTFLGGSCAETSLSSRITAQLALAVQPDLVLAKPGMGIDEAVALMQNEMSRELAWLKQKSKQQ